jgi:hypothetical protein
MTQSQVNPDRKATRQPTPRQPTKPVGAAVVIAL